MAFLNDAVLKTDLMGELHKEVKSLEEDSWMFQGPRSRIHLISRRGYLFLSLSQIIPIIQNIDSY